MKLLAIDTSGLVAAAAVTEDGLLLAEYRTQYKKTHSQMLVPMLDALRDAIELDMSTLDAVAVAAGPGSFTGLRIGAATAKGLAFALRIPIVPVPTLDAMAWQLFGEPGIVCPMMDARRGQVYTGLYRFDRFSADGGRETDAPAGRETGMMETVRASCAVSAEEILEQINRLGEPAVFLGDGVPVYEALIREKARVPVRFAPLWKNRQSAAALADLAARCYAAGETVDADAFSPFYLRASQAEREAAEKAAAEASDKERRNDPSDVIIREMTAQDAEEAAALEEKYLGQEAWSAALLREAADRRDTVYLVALSAGRQIGHAGLRAVCGEGEITNVCVDDAFRRQGVGLRLVRGLIERGGTVGAGDCTLEVRADNMPARGLYEKAGFRQEGVRPGFYGNPRDDAVIMWLRG